MIPFIAEPILNAHGRTVALELLLRPSSGTPSAFLADLGNARASVMRRAIQDALRNLGSHYASRQERCPTVHINADAADLPAFAVHLTHTARSAGFTPAQITVELTEHTDDHASLRQLHAEGFTLALDDIGREPFSDLLHLSIFSVVKTDRCLIRDPATLIQHARTHLARGRKVIIEGIESADDHTLALTAGASATQGYYHYPPLHLSGTRTVKAAG